MNDLKQKNIIITGASGGIGNSIVKKFYENGANILATGTKKEKLEDLKSKFKNIKTLSFDISQHIEIENFIENAIKELGGDLYCMVNNAGITKDNLSIRMTYEEWDKANKEFITFVAEDSLNFLTNFNKKIDFLFLDSLDGQFEGASKHQLEEIKIAKNYLHDQSLVLLDDKGDKTKLSINYMLDNNFKILNETREQVLLSY